MSRAHQPTCPQVGPLPLSPGIFPLGEERISYFLTFSFIHLFIQHQLWAWHGDGHWRGGAGNHNVPDFYTLTVWTECCSVGEFSEHCHFQRNTVGEAPPVAWHSGTFPGIPGGDISPLRFMSVPPISLPPPYPCKGRGELLCALCSR